MSSGKLLEEARASKKKLFLEFGGQGAPFLKELTKLHEEEGLKKYFDTCFQAFSDFEKKHKGSPLISEGMDLKGWVNDNSKAPDENYLIRGSISIASIFVTHMAAFTNFLQKGYPMPELIENTFGATGHSQGVAAAAFASLGKDGEEYYEALYKYTTYMLNMGFHGQASYSRFTIEDEFLKISAELGDKNPAPMVACIGYTRDELESRVNFFNDQEKASGKDMIHISLYNTPNSMIVSGWPERVIAFRKKYKPEMDERGCKFVYLKTTAPYHCPLTSSSIEVFDKALKEDMDFPFTQADLKVPVFSFVSGKDLRTETKNLGSLLFDEVVVQNLHWDLSLSEVVKNSEKIEAIVDFGPSRTVAGLTQAQLDAAQKQIRILCLSNPKDLKAIF
ncbi:MAG: ACP S-malonyltransferase [Leptospiraceae bacterium]|nr:ACP S-malonyltransferase [Leptospiraceae bacterium]MCP5498766.1 ACP S-malonyltransferase [Leptospiraceae bacterium]